MKIEDFKFRVWNETNKFYVDKSKNEYNDEKTMFIPTIAQHADFDHSVFIKFIYLGDKKGYFDVLSSSHNIDIKDEAINKSEYIIELYIGLTDKNDKEIYVGDILRVTCPEDGFDKMFEVVHSMLYGVELEGDSCVFDTKILRLDNHIVEVIGNIHEDKELLT